MEKIKAGSAAYTLLCHLLTCPHLAQELNTLHDLALYDSGDALLCTEEKQALQNTKELSLRLQHLKEEDWQVLRNLL